VSNPKIGLIFKLCRAIKKLTAFKNEGVAKSGNSVVNF